MKKIYLAIAFIASFFNANAQGVNEALQYSIIDVNGSARFRAVSGAFGALGGDLSAIGINPASSVVFANNQFAFTLNNNCNSIKSQYFDTKTETSNNNLNFNQIGGVFVFKNENKSSNWNKFALALNYDNQADFRNSVFLSGENPSNSIDQYFLNQAKGMKFSDISGLEYNQMSFRQTQVALGYDSQLLDYDTSFYANISHASDGKKYLQQSKYKNTGYNGKLSFNFSAEYYKKLMIGINLNAHFSNFTQQKTFFEKNEKDSYSSGATVKSISFNNELQSKGAGFSLQVGGIYKLTPELRLGLTYDSPTWMVIEDQLAQRISTTGVVVQNPGPPPVYTSFNNNIDPKTNIVFDPYTIVTPDKWTFSGAYVFGKKGFISFDYSIKNYSSIKFKPFNDFNDPKGNNSNNIFPILFGVSNEFRVGIEQKIYQWSLRGGFRHEGSPYVNKGYMSDLNGFSAGIGYNWGGTKLDFSYSNAYRTYSEEIFQDIPDLAHFSRRNHNFTISLAFEL